MSQSELGLLRIHHLDAQPSYSDIFPLFSLAVVTMQPRINSNIHPMTPPFSSMTDSNTASSRKKDLPDLYRTAVERACVCV